MQNEMQRGIQNRFKMRHPALALTLMAALMSIGGHASAINLQEAYAMALQNDPVYRSAYYDQQVGKESAIIGRSALLPSLQGNYNFSKNRTDITATNALGRESLTCVGDSWPAGAARCDLGCPGGCLQQLGPERTTAGVARFHRENTCL